MATVGDEGGLTAARIETSTVGGFASRHALALIVCLGAALRFGTIGTQGFWWDELATLHVIQNGPVDLLKGVQVSESNPPLYYLLAGAWERVFGSSEFGIRSLSALVGTATIPAVYAAAKALSSRRVGLIAAALTATSPILVWYSQETRNYSLLVFLSALAFFFFARALDDRDHRWLWAWALASGLALCTHYFALTVIVPQAVWLLIRRPGPRLDTGFAIGTIAAVGMALLPLLATQRGRGAWIDDYSLSDRLFRLPEHLLVGLQAPWEILPAIVVGVVVLIALYGAVEAEGRTRRAIAVAGGVAFAGFGVLLIAVAAGDDYIITRNLLELWAPLAVALAAAFVAASPRWLGVASAAGVCALGTGLVIWTVLTPDAQRLDYSQLAEELGATKQDRLIVSDSGFSEPLVVDLGGSRIATDDDLSASELVVVRQRPAEDYSLGFCWWTANCGGADVEPLPPFQVPARFQLERTGSTDAFDYSVYTAARPTAIERPVEYYTPRVFLQTPE